MRVNQYYVRTVTLVHVYLGNDMGHGICETGQNPMKARTPKLDQVEQVDHRCSPLFPIAEHGILPNCPIAHKNFPNLDDVPPMASGYAPGTSMGREESPDDVQKKLGHFCQKGKKKKKEKKRRKKKEGKKKERGRERNRNPQISEPFSIELDKTVRPDRKVLFHNLIGQFVAIDRGEGVEFRSMYSHIVQAIASTVM